MADNHYSIMDIQKQYYHNQVNNASPIQLVIMTHDLIIKACQKQDEEQAIKGLRALADALDFNYPEISLGLYNIYQWCIRSIQEKNFLEVSKTIKELRDSWQETQSTFSPNKKTKNSVYVKG